MAGDIVQRSMLASGCLHGHECIAKKRVGHCRWGSQSFLNLLGVLNTRLLLNARKRVPLVYVRSGLQTWLHP